MHYDQDVILFPSSTNFLSLIDEKSISSLSNGVAMNVFLLTILIANTGVVVAERTQQATKLCIAVEGVPMMTIVFRLYKNQDRVEAIHVYSASESDSSHSSRIENEQCRVSGSGLDNDPYEISLNVSLVDASMGSECGAFKVTAAPPVFRIRLRTVEYAGFDVSTDAFYDVTCSYTDRLRVQRTLHNLVDAQETKVVTLQPEKVLTSLNVRNTDDRPLTSTTLGDDVYLHLRFFSRITTNNYDVFGKNFYVAFPGDPEGGSSMNYHLFIGNPSPSTAYISVQNATTNTQYTVQMGDLYLVPPTMQALGDRERTDTKTVKITSTEEIYIIAQSENVDTRTRAWFVVYPAETVGTSYTLLLPKADLNFFSMVAVIATASDTDVTFTNPPWNSEPLLLPDDISGLNQKEAFQAVTSSTSNNANGIRLTANKPVTVIVGVRGRNGSASVLSMEQLPHEETLGKSFILFKRWADCVSTDAGGTLDVQNTVMVSVTNTFYHFEQADEAPFGISSTTPMLCAAVVEDAEGDTKFTMIPSIENWSGSYIFSTPFNQEYRLTIIIQEGSKDELAITSREETTDGTALTWESVIIPSSWTTGYSYTTYTTKVYDGPTIKIDHPSAKFLVVLESVTRNAMTVAPGVHLSHLNPKGGCNKTVGYAGDLVDNDCDGKVDEDIVVNQDTGDDALDLRGNSQGQALAVRVRPYNCIARPDQNWQDVTSSVTIIDSNGCVSGTVGDPLIPNSTFLSLSDDNAYPQEYSTGVFQMARFVSSPVVYFRCQLEFCYSYSDTKCTTNVCDNGTVTDRKRRASNNDVTVEAAVNVAGNSLKSVSPSQTENTKVPVSCYELPEYTGSVAAMFIPLLITLVVTAFLSRKLLRDIGRIDMYDS